MRTLSLCSGYGGLDLALELAVGPVEHVAFCEYDKHPAAILAHHWPDVPNLHDLTTLPYRVRSGEVDLPDLDWLTAGYPCQPFSHAGKRKGTTDERHLWPYIADLAGLVRPRRLLLENVAGHVSLGLDAVLGDLAALGYDARWGVVRAADAGAPHGRARVFVVATNARSGSLPRPAAAKNGLRVAPERGAVPAPDADRFGHERRGRARDGWAGPADSGEPAPHSPSDGRLEGRPEPARLLGGPDAPERGGAAPADARREHGQRRPDALGGGPGPRRPADEPQRPAAAVAVAWGTYASAVHRWEAVLGRPAPRPTEPGRSGERLSPAFVEWMMGLPAGWVTAVPGLPRNAMLKALGNGVVPQQAALALRMLGVSACEVAA